VEPKETDDDDEVNDDVSSVSAASKAKRSEAEIVQDYSIADSSEEDSYVEMEGIKNYLDDSDDDDEGNDDDDGEVNDDVSSVSAASKAMRSEAEIVQDYSIADSSEEDSYDEVTEIQKYLDASS